MLCSTTAPHTPLFSHYSPRRDVLAHPPLTQAKRMKTLIIITSFIALTHFSKAEDLEQKIERLSQEFETIRTEIREIEDFNERATATEQIREHASDWYPFRFLYTPNGSDELQEDYTDKLLIDAVYSPFIAEQAHYERTIIHTEGNDDRARELMALRAHTLCRLYPIGSRLTPTEDIHFAQTIFQIYQHVPDAVVNALNENLPRWNSDEKSVALLIFDHHGLSETRDQLKSLDTKRFKIVATLAESFFERVDRDKETRIIDE